MIILCNILLKNNNIVIVNGKPTIYVTNKVFSEILRKPELAREIYAELLKMGFTDVPIFGQLGELRDGVYCDKDFISTTVVDKRKKELGFYESF